IPLRVGSHLKVPVYGAGGGATGFQAGCAAAVSKTRPPHAAPPIVFPLAAAGLPNEKVGSAEQPLDVDDEPQYPTDIVGPSNDGATYPVADVTRTVNLMSASLQLFA